MTSVYDSQSQKYIITIVIPRPYTSIKKPLRKTVGEYKTFAEAKAASDAAVLIRDEVIKHYKKNNEPDMNDKQLIAPQPTKNFCNNFYN